MKNRRKLISIVLLCILTAAISASVFIFGKDTKYVSEVDEKKVETAYNLLNNYLITKTVNYNDFLANKTVDFGNENGSAQPNTGTTTEGYDDLAVTLDYNKYTEYTVNVEKPGLYNLILDYKPLGKTLIDFNVSIAINGAQQYDEMGNIILPLFWKDQTKNFPTDRYGDETAPYQERKDGWTSLYLYNSTYSTAKPLMFQLEAGENIIRVTNVSGSELGLGKLEVAAPVNDTPDYAAYHEQYTGDIVTDLIPISSVDYVEKNTSQAIYSSENNPAVKPHDSINKKLNTLAFIEAGSEIKYQFDAPKDGLYHIAIHYKNPKEEFDVFNSIKIDGKVPFNELENYAFSSTGKQWANEVLGDAEGNPYDIYLTQGTHTISIRTEMEPIDKALQYAKVLSDHITQFDMAITKITGSAVDKNRTWKMTRYIPEIPQYLEAYATLINEIKYLLQDYTPNGVNSAMLSDLDEAMAFINQMAEYPDEIALYQDNLAKSRDNSVLKCVSDFSAKLSDQIFILNAIYVYGNEKLPQANPNIVQSLWNGTKTLVNSYISDKFKVKKDPEVLNVWVNRATTHVDLLQKMVDTEFTPKTGIKVNVSIMPDSNKLILAAAADEAPDVALGLYSNIPFELSSRGALYDMTQFDDFWKIEGRFVPGASVSYVYNEGVYAIPETLEFQALVYRTDIFKELGLTPPDTWQEVTDMCPTLQRYGMNFYHIISSNAGYKWYYQSSNTIFQNNGKLYTDDGLRTAIDQPNAVKGMQAMGDLFTKYSMPKEVGSFFNEFRYGTLPIGIIGKDDYILIKNGAPELTGKWALATRLLAM
jgi:hypothetical protein